MIYFECHWNYVELRIFLRTWSGSWPTKSLISLSGFICRTTEFHSSTGSQPKLDWQSYTISQIHLDKSGPKHLLPVENKNLVTTTNRHLESPLHNYLCMPSTDYFLSDIHITCPGSMRSSWCCKPYGRRWSVSVITKKLISKRWLLYRYFDSILPPAPPPSRTTGAIGLKSPRTQNHSNLK